MVYYISAAEAVHGKGEKSLQHTAGYKQKKLPLANQTQRASSALDPLLRGHSGNDPAEEVDQEISAGPFLAAGNDIHQEIIRYNVDLCPVQGGREHGGVVGSGL